MKRRDFLKLLASTSLGAFGVPTFAVRNVFGDESATKMKLKDACDSLLDKPREFVYLLGAAYDQNTPDLRLSCAAVTYFAHVGGDVNALIKQATELKNEPGVAPFLTALRQALCPAVGTRDLIDFGYYGECRLNFEAMVICSVWLGVSPAQHIEAVKGRGMGGSYAVDLIAAYCKQYGSTLALLEMADAEVVVTWDKALA